MVRVLLIVALLGSLATGALSYLINQQKKDALAAQHQAQSNLDGANKKLASTQKDLTDTKSKLDDTQKQLDDATANSKATQAALTAAQAAKADLEGKVSSAEQKANAAQAAADDAKGQLGTKDAAAKAAQDKADQLAKDKLQLSDQLDGAKKEVDRLKDVIDRQKTGALPPGINGKVVSVNRNWNFVVLNIGEKDGLVENAELTVSRNAGGKKTVIGKVKIVSTEANTAVADIEVTTLQGQIENGDDVLN